MDNLLWEGVLRVEYESAVWSPYTKENKENILKWFKEGQSDGCQMISLHTVVLRR